MPRYEFVDGSSSKFWDITLDGSSFTVVYGKIGTAGTTQTKTFDDDAKALKEHDKLVAEKTKKGYAEVGGSTSTSTSTSSSSWPSPAAKAPSVKAAKPKAAAPDDTAVVTTTTTPVATPAAAPVAGVAPKPAPSVGEENAIFWTEALKKRVMPRVGGVEVKIAPLLSAAKSLALVHKGVLDREEVGKTRTIARKVAGAEALAKINAAVAAGTVLDVDTASVLLSWLGSQVDYGTALLFGPAVEWLVATIGYPATTQALLVSLEQSFIDTDPQAKAGAIALVQLPPSGWNVSFQEGHSLRGLDRLRELLVLASPEERAAAEQVAAGLRDSDGQRVATSFLFPQRTDWVAADMALFGQQPGWYCLLASLRDAAALPAGTTLRVDEMITHAAVHAGASDFATTLLDGCGLGAASIFVTAIASKYAGADLYRAWYQTLAAVGDDAAITTLASNIGEKEAQAALSEAAANQPRRVLRLIAGAAAARGKAGEPARNVLGVLVCRSPALVAEVLPHLSAEAAKAVNAILAEAGDVVADAADADIPGFLRAPPWHAKKAKAAGPVKLDLKMKPLSPTTSWAKQEREKWEQQCGWGEIARTTEQWQKLASSSQELVDTADLATMPTEFAEQLAPRTTRNGWSDDGWYARIVARHEHKAHAFYVRRLDEDFAKFLPLLVPLGRDAYALPMATALSTKKSLKDTAKSWLLRHPKHAATGLLPSALGKAGKDRDAAEAALRFVASNGHEAALLEVAADNGVKDELQQILSASAFDKFPAKPPKLPTWADPAALPRPVLKATATSSKGALSLAATTAFVEMLAFSPVDDPYAGIEVLKRVCEPKSLARSVWALFQAWLVNGAPSKEGWGMTALGFFGDDDAARRLAAYTREWPGESANARAVSALDVLATIGSDVALMHLNAIALKSKFKGLQAKAQEKIEVIAEARGFTREELEDRLAPDLGLNDDGSLALDFGPRSFTVGFDEALRPFVKDSDGTRLKDLPKPKQTDDDEKAKAAVELWGQLKKDAKQAASLQILRLEMAMCGRRRFAAADFVELFVQHPLVVHIVRRLVWATYDAGGKLTSTFRVAEDRTFADANDDGFVLDDAATVGIPHPLELSDAVTAQWSQVFGDYELVQPFAQLGRPTAVADDQQKASTVLDMVKDITVKTGKVLGLEARRWRRGPPQDGGVVGWMEKHLTDGRTITLDLEPGLFTGMLSESPEQKLGSAVIGQAGYWGSSQNHEAFSTLDAITYSELVRDLESLRS